MNNYSDNYPVAECEKSFEDPREPRSPQKERSVKDQLSVIEANLFEIRYTLVDAIAGLTGCSTKDVEIKPQDPSCMQDSLTQIGELADHCMSLSKRLHDLMF